MCAQVGWDMKARAGKKPVVLELGGNAAALVEDYRGDDELDAIVSKITFGAFYQSGQSCISLQRLMVRQVRGVPSCLTNSVCMSFIYILVAYFNLEFFAVRTFLHIVMVRLSKRSHWLIHLHLVAAHLNEFQSRWGHAANHLLQWNELIESFPKVVSKFS